MFKGIATSGSSTTGNIVFTTALNTNNNTNYDSTNNVVNIVTPGYYDVTVMVNNTNVTAGAVALTIYANGTALANSKVSQTLTAGDTYNLTAHDVIKVNPTDITETANISAKLSVSGETINNGLIIIERRK